jgi:hypothetical protein
MNVTDELARLSDLHRDGTLTDEELEGQSTNSEWPGGIPGIRSST